MAKDVVVVRLEHQHTGLRALREKAQQQQEQCQLPAHEHLLKLRNTCLDLAYLVLRDVKDSRGLPAIQHVLATAEKAGTVFGICTVLLGAVLDHGMRLGINADVLVDNYKISSELVDIADALRHRENEDCRQRRDRIVQHYAAIKAEMDSVIEKANIARYHEPTLQDLDTCSNFLGSALTLKCHSNYRMNRDFDYLIDVINMSTLVPMMYSDEYARDDEQMISYCLYFGYECYADRRITIRYLAKIQPDHSVNMEVSTMVNANEFSDHCLYRNRKMTIRFRCVQQVYEYLEQVRARLALAPNVELRRQQRTLTNVTMGLILKEKFILEEIDRKHC